MICECSGQPDKLICGQITSALVLLIALYAPGRIVCAPAPTNRQAEYPAQDCNCAVCSTRRAFADSPMQFINIAKGDVGHLHAAKCRTDIALDDLPIAFRSRDTFAWDVFVDEPVTGGADCGGSPFSLVFTDRVC